MLTVAGASMVLPGLPCPTLNKSIVGMNHKMFWLTTAGGSLVDCRLKIVLDVQVPIQQVIFIQVRTGNLALLSLENGEYGKNILKVPVLSTSTQLILF